MTCIIGFTDRENNISWIGGDSLGSDGYIKATEMPSKVFRNETFTNVLIGGTTTFRHLDLLKYSESLFDEIDWYKKANIDHKYMVTKFIPKVIELFKYGIIGEPETKRGGNFIVATPGKIFEVQPDYSVLEPELGICSVGCGEDVAMGSLITTLDFDMTPQEKIIKALEAAEQYCCGVQRPFRILCTDLVVSDILSAKDRKNSEGYSDPTVYAAMKNIARDEDRFRKLRKVILNICDVAGFEIRGPLILMDKKTGKIWR